MPCEASSPRTTPTSRPSSPSCCSSCPTCARSTTCTLSSCWPSRSTLESSSTFKHLTASDTNYETETAQSPHTSPPTHPTQTSQIQRDQEKPRGPQAPPQLPTSPVHVAPVRLMQRGSGVRGRLRPQKGTFVKKSKKQNKADFSMGKKEDHILQKLFLCL